MEEGLNAQQYSPLTLAYMGDAVFEIFVRERLVRDANRSVNKLHRLSSSLVKAEAQSRMIKAIKDELTQDEIDIYKRGRNAKTRTTAKNASVKDYRRATGFEALLGFLYLDGQHERLNELMEKAVQSESERDKAI